MTFLSCASFSHDIYINANYVNAFDPFPRKRGDKSRIGDACLSVGNGKKTCFGVLRIEILPRCGQRDLVNHQKVRLCNPQNLLIS
jgi:3',5'-cyclic AMP phosphodiesterase CpdA